MKSKYNRRDFLRLGVGAGAGLALGSVAFSGCGSGLIGNHRQVKAAAMDRVGVGFVGVGGRGTHLLKLFLKQEGVEVRAICDIVEEKVARGKRLVEKAGQAEPAGYSLGETDFKRLCEKEQLDLVVTATPWKWHVPVCVAAMKNGKHAASEVPAAVTINECWELVEESEKNNKYCVMLENCCYGRSEMMVLNMVRQNVFGELLHAEAGYMHDLRAIKLSSSGEGLWRGDHSAKRNGNLYPTHGLGPVAQCLNINRGNQFDYLVSMSTKARGLSSYAKEHLGPEHARSKIDYKNGDVNSSLIRTVGGETIVLQHDCDTPRPYNRINLVQGTKAIFRGYPDRIFIEGTTKGHKYEPAGKYRGQYEHPLWKALDKKAKGGGHGGMDYMMVYRLIQSLRSGTAPDMDVYDAAAWSSISQATERSVAQGSKPVKIPDFTRGRWKNRQPLGIIGA